MTDKNIRLFSIAIIVMLSIVSIIGILSLDFSKSFEVVNQYGDMVRIYGNGIYSGDSYFKAPILIGTDIAVLLFLVPLFVCGFVRTIKNKSSRNLINMMSLYSAAFYYSSSLALGVKYNVLHLLYIALFGSTLIGMFYIYSEIDIKKIRYSHTKGVEIFLVLSGLALIIAWLPDIIPTLFNGKSLKLIEVYTTEITYVLDMGLIGPLCFISLIMLRKGNQVGTIILANIFKLCIVIGVMMIPQSVIQYLSGTELPLAVLITKSASFLVLGIFAFYFESKLYGCFDQPKNSHKHCNTITQAKC